MHNEKRSRRGDLLIAPLRVKTIHISSLILAARSNFFLKLFSNGMLESEQKNVTLQIDTSEEASLVDLLKYIYSNKLPTSLNGLLDLLVSADKFEVASCLRDCTRSLQNLPMTCTSASVYLGLPPSLLTSPIIEPLTDSAKQFLTANFMDLDKFKMLNLPLAGILAVLSSDDLEVTSEDVVYDFVLAWAQKHYSDLEERRGILKTHLLRLIRFPFMTTAKLTEEAVQTCGDIDPEDAFKIVIRALGFKAETPHRKRCLAAEEGSAASRHQFVECSCKRQPIQLVELGSPHQQCIVYLHFTREKLTHIFPEGLIMSETFQLGNQELVLIGECYTATDKIPYFWLALQVLGSATCTVNYEIQLRMNPTEKFKSWVEGSHTFSEQEQVKYFKSVRWTKFVGVDCTYFINNVFHARADLTIME